MTRRFSSLSSVLRAWPAVCLMALAGVANAGLSSAVLRIELKERVQVVQAQVALTDVAHISSENLDLLRRAMAVPLGAAPRAGEAVSLDRAQLQRWLRTQMGLGVEQVQWLGAPVTEVRRSTTEIAGEKLQSVAEAALRKHLESTLANVPKARIEIQAIATPANLSMPAATSSLVVRPLDTLPLSSRMLVWVDAFANGQYVRSISVRFEVATYMSVAVAASSLSAGATLQPTDWQEREIDVTRTPDAVVAVPQVAQKVRRAVRSGEVITHAHLQGAPVVQRGDWANLTARTGLVALERRVEVMQDGELGQMVRVKPANSAGSLVARVTGPGSVEMQP